MSGARRKLCFAPATLEGRAPINAIIRMREEEEIRLLPPQQLISRAYAHDFAVRLDLMVGEEQRFVTEPEEEIGDLASG